MSGNTDLLVTDTFLKKKVYQSVSGATIICLVQRDTSPSHRVDQDVDLLRIELIRMWIVACGMMSHSSSMDVQSYWILAETGRPCRARRSRASQTCSMGDMSGEYAGQN